MSDCSLSPLQLGSQSCSDFLSSLKNTMPVLIDAHGKTHQLCRQQSLQTVLPLHHAGNPTIVLLGSLTAPRAAEQAQWFLFGQQYGFIFHWLSHIRALETYLLLHAEKRSCLAVFIPEETL